MFDQPSERAFYHPPSWQDLEPGGGVTAFDDLNRRCHNVFVHGTLDRTLLLFEPPLAVDGPAARPGLATYRSLVEKGDLDAAFEFAMLNWVRVPGEAIPEIRKTPLWDACVPLTPTLTRELEQLDALGDDLGMDHFAHLVDPAGFSEVVRAAALS